ncbi:thioredoxin H2-like [Salvia divinorum]|uniref:Thioredoxin H2-like n=1 Tax=Salvia divinorum TaxID=28513 RepID=A0ABD1HJS9_SALDI
MGAGVSTGYATSPARTYGSTTMKGQVVAFHSSKTWKIHFEASKQTPKLLVVDFTAAWCGPCQYIQPAEFGVQTMPTFVLMKRGREVDKLVGAKKEDLRKMIDKHRI